MVVRVLAAASMAAAAQGCGDRPLRLEIDLCVFVRTRAALRLAAHRCTELACVDTLGFHADPKADTTANRTLWSAGATIRPTRNPVSNRTHPQHGHSATRGARASERC